jgi:hypothetical protein
VQQTTQVVYNRITEISKKYNNQGATPGKLLWGCNRRVLPFFFTVYLFPFPLYLIIPQLSQAMCAIRLHQSVNQPNKVLPAYSLASTSSHPPREFAVITPKHGISN